MDSFYFLACKMPNCSHRTLSSCNMCRASTPPNDVEATANRLGTRRPPTFRGLFLTRPIHFLRWRILCICEGSSLASTACRCTTPSVDLPRMHRRSSYFGGCELHARRVAARRYLLRTLARKACPVKRMEDQRFRGGGAGGVDVWTWTRLALWSWIDSKRCVCSNAKVNPPRPRGRREGRSGPERVGRVDRVFSRNSCAAAVRPPPELSVSGGNTLSSRK